MDPAENIIHVQNQEDNMIYSFSIKTIVCSWSGRCYEECYRLSNDTILLPSERNSAGDYYGGAGMQGMYLRTGILYCPVYDELSDCGVSRRRVLLQHDLLFHSLPTIDDCTCYRIKDWIERAIVHLFCQGFKICTAAQ